MSSISGIQNSGPGAIASTKPTSNTTQSASTPQPSESTSSGGAASEVKFPTPTFTLDPLLNRVIIEYRDPNNGETTQQVPSKSQLRLYQVNQNAAKPLASSANGGQGQSGTTPNGTTPNTAGNAAAVTGASPVDTGGTGSATAPVSAAQTTAAAQATAAPTQSAPTASASPTNSNA